ncbi:TfoX/Sxy family protein [Pseudokineococcus sp. 1T1Z-3]|uniref:TfoX/Sxy family protein n=1 Tax=Pseudokineococcus sp. 1T1Z-3 TaxID=3132745 RepID=UPI003099493D
MAYDEELAERVRDALADRPVREQKMFGGLAFMVDDRMVVCVGAGGGALLVRVSPDDDAELVQRQGAARGQMGAGRSMGTGWIAVDEQAVASEEDLDVWMAAALAFHADQAGREKPKRR